MTEPNTEWVTVFSSINMVHASMVKGFLETHDIPVMLRDEHLGSLQTTWSVVAGGVKVQVPKEKETEAAELLKQLEINEIHGAGERNWAKAYLPFGLAVFVVVAVFIFINKCS